MSLTMHEEQPAPCGCVRVRLAEADDFPAIRAVILAAYEEYETAIGPDAYDRYLDDLLDLELHAQNGPLIVAEVDGAVEDPAPSTPMPQPKVLAGRSDGRAGALLPCTRQPGDTASRGPCWRPRRTSPTSTAHPCSPSTRST